MFCTIHVFQILRKILRTTLALNIGQRYFMPGHVHVCKAGNRTSCIIVTCHWLCVLFVWHNLHIITISYSSSVFFSFLFPVCWFLFIFIFLCVLWSVYNVYHVYGCTCAKYGSYKLLKTVRFLAHPVYINVSRHSSLRFSRQNRNTEMMDFHTTRADPE